MKTSKDMNNLEIADLLRAVAASYQLEDENKNKFRIIAYERAADAVEHLSSETKDVWDEGKLSDISGVGESIASNLSEIFKTGKSLHFEDLLKNIPPSVFKLMELPRIGVKTAFKLVKYLKLEKSKNPYTDLEKLAKSGKIAAIEGFGTESERDIIRSIEESRRMLKRHLLPYASNIADEISEWLKKDKNTLKVNALGSLRRFASTVGDIDLSVATYDSLKVIDRFTKYPKLARIIEKGSKTASIMLPGNVHVDLMTTTPESYGSLLQHFTGSKHHNIALREYALRNGLSLSEYGIKDKKGKTLKFENEETFYKYLGLSYIPPELREDSGEIEVALNKAIPNLLTVEDIKGDLQIHSNYNTETSHDIGESSIDEIVKKANYMGYEYIALTDHNPSRSGHTEKEILEILKSRKELIDKINYSILNSDKNRVRKVYNALEIDIMQDGNLTIPEYALDLLDFALVSIHSSFRQKKDQATKRVINALSSKKVLIFAHPTGRLLNRREGVDLDFQKIFEYCKLKGKWIEINADPARLDLPDFLVKDAVSSGVKLTLGTDSHNVDSMDNMKWGVSVARRGWAKRSDIINTLSFEIFDKMINERG